MARTRSARNDSQIRPSLLAMIGVGIAVVMVIKGNQPGQLLSHRSVSEGTFYLVYLRSRHRGGSDREHCIAHQFPAIVRAIYVKWGDQVQTGDPLFKVDSSDLQAQELPALAKVKEAEANLAKVRTDSGSARA